MRKYFARNGKQQFMPSIQEAMAGNSIGEGFCVACGSTQTGVEPDATKYTCEACKMPKVYGFEQLVSMGLTYEG